MFCISQFTLPTCKHKKISACFRANNGPWVNAFSNLAVGLARLISKMQIQFCLGSLFSWQTNHLANHHCVCSLLLNNASFLFTNQAGRNYRFFSPQAYLLAFRSPCFSRNSILLSLLLSPLLLWRRSSRNLQKSFRFSTDMEKQSAPMLCWVC